MVNRTQLLNKIDTQNFPKKLLFILRIISVFINVSMNMVALLPIFSWLRYEVGLNWKTVNTSRIFCIEFREWIFPHFYHRVTDRRQDEPGWKNPGFLDGAKFSIKYLSALKTFLLQKGNYSSYEFWNFPICYWRHLGILCSDRGVWTGIHRIQNVKDCSGICTKQTTFFSLKYIQPHHKNDKYLCFMRIQGVNYEGTWKFFKRIN